jgi:hypothetical protein
MLEVLLQKIGSIEAVVILAIVVYNSLLTAVVAVLDFAKKPLPNNHWSFKVVTILQKVLDFLTANKKH